MVDAVVASAGPLARIDGVRGVVHAVFPNSVVVEPRDGPLIVIHDQSRGHTPTSLVLQGVCPARWEAAPGDAVTGRLGHLRLGNLLLDGRQARTWRPRAPVPRSTAPDPHPLATAVEKIAADAMRRLGPARRRLAAALAAQDANGVRCAAAALVGRGPGLTPSGDDALVGVLAALHRVGPRDVSAGPLRLLRSALQPLLARTTPISAHYLRLALQGDFGEHLAGLVDAIGPCGTVDLDRVARVRSAGATSGADALVGVVAGLHLLREAFLSTHRVPQAA
jgi:hypothetical protein